MAVSLRLIVFVLAALVFAVALLPLRLVVAVAGLPVAASRIDGTVWNATLRDAVVAGYAVGDIAVKGRVGALLSGRLGADVQVKGPLVTGDATALASMGGLAFSDTALTVQLTPLGLRDAFGAPLRGEVEVTIPKLRLSHTHCLSGTATLRTDALRRSASYYGGEGFELLGTGMCEDGAFVLPLIGTGPEGQASATIRVARGGYTTELVVTPVDDRLAEALSLYGFEREGNQYSLIQRGEVFQ